jgi:hypothetical protein
MVKTGISNKNNKKESYKFCVYSCNTYYIIKEFVTEYFNNAAILRDDDENLHFQGRSINLLSEELVKILIDEMASQRHALAINDRNIRELIGLLKDKNKREREKRW